MRLLLILDAAMETAQKTHTYEDYAALPEGAPYQLIDGALVMSPSPTFAHQRIIMEIAFAMMEFVKNQKLGEVVLAPFDVYFTDTDVFQPDILFVSKERLDLIHPNQLKGAPDLVVEVLSPSTGYYDLTHKKRMYEAHGVREYWIVDPEQKSVEVYANTGTLFELRSRLVEEGQVTSGVLDGFTLALPTLLP